MMRDIFLAPAYTALLAANISYDSSPEPPFQKLKTARKAVLLEHERRQHVGTYDELIAELDYAKERAKELIRKLSNDSLSLPC